MIEFDKVKKELAGEAKFRVGQALKAVYQQGISSWDELSVFSKDLREKMNLACPLDIEAEIHESLDKKTIKAVFPVEGGKIEAVLMKHQGRNTVCLSTQLGCALACDFCFTGQHGFYRNLTSDEMLIQVLFFSRLLIKDGQRVSNLVFMGMGEPFNNYDELILAIKLLNDNDLFGIGARHISISSSGVVPGIRKLANEKMQLNLSISLHAHNNETRDALMPINKVYPIEVLLGAVREYIKKTKRRVMIEYLMLRGVNDAPRDAYALSKLLKNELGELFFVNLIKYNSSSSYKASDVNSVGVFKRILIDEGIDTVERYRFGKDIKAACGQLGGPLANAGEDKN